MRLMGRSAIHAPSSLNQPRRSASAISSEELCIVTIVARCVPGIDLRFRLSEWVTAWWLLSSFRDYLYVTSFYYRFPGFETS
jgi:hypothetical protein